jgi:hypothetical protein
MKVLLKELLPAWIWILGCGFIISLLSTILNHFVMAGVNPYLSLIFLLVVHGINLILIYTCIYLYRNISLKGTISFWSAFLMVILIFLAISFLYLLLTNFINYGSLFQPTNQDVSRRYYSYSDEKKTIYDEIKKVIPFLFLGLIAFFIAKNLSAKTPSVSQDILDDFNS